MGRFRNKHFGGHRGGRHKPWRKHWHPRPPYRPPQNLGIRYPKPTGISGFSGSEPFIISLLVAVSTYFLAVKFIDNGIFLLLEIMAWIFFAFLLYRDIFLWANKVSMVDDLAFWGLRILGGVVFFVGIYVGFFTAIASAFVKNSAPMGVPVYSLLTGLVLLGLFIVFRTNRRHNLVGVYNAQ